MKRFWLFAGDYHYPLGGMDDFIEDFDLLEKAKKVKKDMLYLKCGTDWAHIVDIETKEIY